LRRLSKVLLKKHHPKSKSGKYCLPESYGSRPIGKEFSFKDIKEVMEE
jgi:hypothetical protein